MSEVYTQCSEQYDVDTQLSGLLQCISTGNEEALADMGAGLNTFFLIFAGALVFFMQTGFAMLCAGSIRAKNTKNVLLWNLLDSCGGGIAYWACGWAFAYGGDEPGGPITFIGNTDFFLMFNDGTFEVWFFQFAFACAVSSIVAGTVAERCKMTAYLFFSTFMVGFVYPVVSHAFWSYNGWLSPFNVNPLFGSGAIDLAGSGPVHMCGGVAALAAAIVLGPRIGRFYDSDGNLLEEPQSINAHSTTLVFLGTFCLWFGWYGFNPGSVLVVSNATSAQVAALVAANTTLSACAGAVSAMFTSTLLDLRATGVHTYDPAKTCNGCLTGLAAITGGAATVEPWAAVVIGVCAGWVYLFCSSLLIRFRIDDAVDAVPVHMGGGAWGVIATGLFTSPQRLLNYVGRETDFGWFYEWGAGSGNFTLLGCQLIAVLFVFAWTFVIMYIYFNVLNYFDMFRIDPLEEEVGMDISRHKGSAYDYDAPNMEAVEDLSIRRSSKHISVEQETAFDKVEKEENVVAEEEVLEEVLEETA